MMSLLQISYKKNQFFYLVLLFHNYCFVLPHFLLDVCNSSALLLLAKNKIKKAAFVCKKDCTLSSNDDPVSGRLS